MAEALLEPGQRVKWRGRRWRVLGLEESGFLRLAGIEPGNRDQVVTPLLALEAGAIQPDVLPLPQLDVERSDRGRWRALHQAILLTMVEGREKLVGLDWGAVAVEPYQLVPLMRIARSPRPRLLIADDAGLGKTAEAGIILRWLAQRHQASRVLIVTRAAPEPERWQREMWLKFGFQFDILRSGDDFVDRRRRAPTVNVFAQQPRVIVSMTLAARQVLLDELRQCSAPFGVVIVDEAHHLADRGARTKRLAVLGRALSRACREGTLLLLTATPHDGKTDSFLSLLRFLDPHIETRAGEVPIGVASRLVVRRLKSEVTLAGGRKFLTPQIHVISTIRDATPEERKVERPLDAYLDWLQAEEARYEGEGARQKAKGCQFLATILRKRVGSSVAALRATLRRRLGLPSDPEDADESVPYVDTEASDPEDEIIDPGAAGEAPPPPLSPVEAKLARPVLEAAQQVPGGRDSKLEATVRLFRSELLGEKVVVFTEYRDTLRAAARRLAAEGINFLLFHGETPDHKRQEAITRFIRDPKVQVFLATDAASEGKNLQHAACHLIHLDVPWNPNRYVQRNGRIDRYGQGREPHIWVLVAADRKKGQGRPEYRALQVLVEKLQRIQDELGSVSPVLPLSHSVVDILRRAEADAERQMAETLEDPAGIRARNDFSRLAVKNRHEIEQAETYVRRLGATDDFEPSVGALLATAFRAWDDSGRLEPFENGQVKVHVPARLRPVLGRAMIPHATFRRDVAVAGQDEEDNAPEFLSPGHPLVETTLRTLREEAADPHYPHRFDVGAGSPEALVLTFSARFVDGKGHTVEERLEAVEVGPEGTVSRDGDPALRRLGLDAPSSGKRPDPNAIARWRAFFSSIAQSARLEAERRAEARGVELTEVLHHLQEQEIEVLALWHQEETTKIESLTLGSGQITFESAQAYEESARQLEMEYELRRQAVRERSQIRVASVELIGGRLIVPEAK